MIPKIKEYEEDQILEALAYYKAIATKLAEIAKQQPNLWYQITMCQSTFNNRHAILVNSGKIKDKKDG